jgi:hypothetical protein
MTKIEQKREREREREREKKRERRRERGGERERDPFSKHLQFWLPRDFVRFNSKL